MVGNFAVALAAANFPTDPSGDWLLRRAFGELVEQSFATARQRVANRALLVACVLVLVFGAIAFILWVGGHDVLAGELSAGQLSAFVFYAAIVAGSVGALSEVWGDLQRATGATERLMEILATRPAIRAPARPAPLPEPARGAIDFERVSFRYPARPDAPALADFDLSVAPGETVALVGPSGAGKTTVFNLLTGVYKPTEGEFWLDGTRMNGKKTYQVVRAGIARTFQNIRLFKQLTVEENVLVAFDESFTYHMGSAIFRTPGFWKQENEMHEKAIDLLRIFNLEGLATTQAANLPYGQQRKLEIARALATGMKLLLLDEPAAGMNPTETEDLLHCINTIRDRFGIAILLIEHDMSLVMSVCQRIQVLDYGRTIASGTPEEIANNPQVISAYLGSDNNDDADGDSTTKAEPEPSIAKTLTEGAR
mgnify:CR=1 FL=1